jgi:predicted PurR-regulated permease PerM
MLSAPSPDLRKALIRRCPDWIKAPLNSSITTPPFGIIRSTAPARSTNLITDEPLLVEDTQRNRNVTRGYIGFFFAIVLVLILAWHLLKELEILYVSALFAVVLMPIVKHIQTLRLRNYRPSRFVAILLLLTLSIASLVLFFSVAFPPVVRDLRQFITDAPARLPILVAKAERFPLARKIGISSAAEKAQSALAATAAYLFTSLPNWLSHLFDILTALFLCIYFMIEGGEAYTYFLSLFPDPSRTRLHATLQRANTKMSKWLLGQGLLMIILGVCSTLVFSILHVRYAILLGVLMGLLNIIPIAGGVVTICFAAGVAALDSWTKMAGVLIFYAVYINIENAVLTPRIMKSSVDLMGLTVLVALLIGTALAGIVGALVAVPTAALISVLIDEYLVQPDQKPLPHHSAVLDQP